MAWGSLVRSCGLWKHRDVPALVSRMMEGWEVTGDTVALGCQGQLPANRSQSNGRFSLIATGAAFCQQTQEHPGNSPAGHGSQPVRPSAQNPAEPPAPLTCRTGT